MFLCLSFRKLYLFILKYLCPVIRFNRNVYAGQHICSDSEILQQWLHGYPARKVVRRPALLQIGHGNSSTKASRGRRGHWSFYPARRRHRSRANNPIGRALIF